MGGMLVPDIIDGDTEVLYRHHSATWMKVIPDDDCWNYGERSEENLDACMNYTVTITPLDEPA